MSTRGEQIVYDKLGLHPDIPLTRKHQALADAVDAALIQPVGCQHCTCTCVNCAPCGDPTGEEGS